jgi:large subunit ribosomal protein L6
MSRVGRMPVILPAAVKITQNGNALTVKGPKGQLTQSFDPHLKITIDSAQLSVETPQAPGYDAMHGLTRALINNMVLGVTDGFKKNLEIEGVGYRAELQGKNLVLALGLSHTVTVEPAAGISFVVDKTQRLLLIEGVDRQLVGETAAKIRSLRPPEPYKGKGIHYQGEKVRRKAGKAGKVGTGAK